MSDADLSARSAAQASAGVDPADADCDVYISIVIATRNAEATLQACLDSIYRQQYRAWEVVAIDGASTDATPDLLRKNAARIAFWLSEPDVGIYSAWNKALLHVRGRWILFLGADDELWDPGVLGLMAARLKLAGTARVVYGKVAVVDGREVQEIRGSDWAACRHEFSRYMCLPHQGVFHNQSLFKEHGPFDERFQISGDYEFLLRELLDGEALFVPDVIVAAMHVGGLSSRRETQILLMRESHRARRAHGLTRLPDLLSPRLFRLSVRTSIERRLGIVWAERVAGLYRSLARRPDRRS